MRVEFLDPAQDELQSAVAWYNRQQAGLGNRFSSEVEQTLERVVNDPTSYERLHPRHHRCRVTGFPYAIVYSTKLDQVLVVAVMHLHRRPGYWLDRLDES